MRPLLATALVLLSYGIAPTPVQAAGHETCIVYSNDAVRKANEAAGLRCGFAGPRWATNPSTHMRWCLGVNEDSVDFEQKKRASFLTFCQHCWSYANSAAQDNKENDQLRCGFSGARWHSDTESHYRWCLSRPGFSLGQPFLERDARASELSKCKAAASNQDCNHYADEATSSANQNIELSCGFTGAAWITDRSAHYQWCLNFGNEKAKAETDARKVNLQQCAEAIKGRTLGKRKKPSAQGFTGTWDTEMLPGGSFGITFSQQGTRVTGQLPNGSLEGTLDGDSAMDFTIAYQSGLSGWGRLTLMQGDSVFSGRWTLKSDPGTLRTWNGKRR